MSKAIVVLARGYNDIKKYHKIILRNIYIAKKLTDLNIPVIIFHEGNIIEYHQNYIKNATPKLNIKFIDVKEKNLAFKDKSYVKRSKECSKHNIGYCHMCSFWFVNFWEFVKEYDYILRIDDDCLINFDIVNVFNILESKVACYGTWVRDDEIYLKYMHNFNMDFLKHHNIPINKLIDDSYVDSYCDAWRSSITGPYTNIIGLNLSKLRENNNLMKYIETVKYSDFIYMYRWGDLPLWGSALTYFFKKEEHIKLKEIKYIHENYKINM